MAGGSRFIWIPVLLSCVFQASDNRHVRQEAINLIGHSNNPEVDRILSNIPITLPEGIDPRNINVTSITIKTCTGVKEQLVQLNTQLQQTILRNIQLGNEAFGSRRELRQLHLQLATCSSTASAITGSYQAQLLNKMKQLLERFDSDTFLILNIIALTREVNTLQKKINHAANATETTDIHVLQRELQQKINELSVKKQQIERSHTNSALILQIISLQNEIWDLEQTGSRRGETNPQPDKRILALQAQLDGKISELRSKGDADSAMLALTFVHSKIVAIQRLISYHIEESRTKAADYQRQWRQKVELLKKKILQLTREENNQDLTQEIFKLQAEVDHLRLLMTNAKKTTDARIKELRVILEEEKKQQENLQKHLEEADYAQAQLIVKILGLMKEVRELDGDQQHQTTSTSQGTTLQTVLQAKEREFAKAQEEINELQRKLRLRSEKCSGLEERYEEVKTEFEQKIAELNRTGDSKAALVLNVINLHDDVKTLTDLISTTQDPDRILELQRQLQEKQDELNSKNADIERLIPHPKIILTVIELQNEIWELQKKAANGTTGGLVEELQTRLDGLITDIGDDNTKQMLKIITLQSQVEQLQRRLSDLQTLGATQVTQLTNDLATKKEELQKYVNELNEKNQTNARLILATTDLHNQLRNLEKEKHDEGKTTSAAITKLREQLKATVEEHSSDQAEIKALQNKLNQTEGQCSSFEDNLKDLQNNLDAKMKELQSKSDSVTSLALQVSTLTLQLEELKRQLQNTESETKIKELQKMIDEKKNELAKKTEELKERSSQPQRILEIITLQTEIEKLANVAANDTDYNKIRALQDHLNFLIDGIQDENNENTKLMFKILAQRDEIARLEKQENSQTQAAMEKIKDLENELEDIRNQIKEKKMVLDSSDTRISDLSTQIMELRKKIKPLEEEISDLKDTNAENVQELQKRLDLTKRQLQDSENRLKDADAKNFNSIMEIADLRTQLKKAQKKASKAAEKNIDELEQQLETQQKENRRLENTNKELQRKLQLKDEKCSGLEERYEEVKTEFEQKIAELNRTGDSKAALVLNVINLHDDVKTLKDLISTTQDPDRILELQRQLQEKQDELNSKNADIERLIPHPKIILTVIELQNEIWELQKKAANGTTGGLVEELQTRLDGLITDIGDDNTKLMLKIITLQSQVEQLQRRLSDLQTLGATQVTQLTNDLATKKEELQKYVNELNEKNQTNARLILATTDLHNQLRNLEKEKHDEGKTTSAAITKLREQLKATVEEHSSDQAEIKALQNKLNQTEAQCSSFENNLKDLQNDLDAKMKELQSKSDSVTSLALQVSTLTLQLEELKRQLQNTESETKIKELQKMIDEKKNELAKKTEELKERSSQPQRILEIITLQTEIEKLANVAANDTDYNKIRALQDHLNFLIDGIQDENNENTKLMFKILAQRDEIARLEKQENSQTQAAMEKIKDLENELEDIRNQIKEKKMVLDSSDTRISDLSTQIMELRKKIKPLEEEISDLKDTNAENVQELQKRLDLTKRQLQDSENRLKDADAKNFNSIMEIADLRTQLKKAQKKASKAAEKNIDELEQQLETQQKENRRLENTNKELQRKLQLKDEKCSGLEERYEEVKTEFEQKIAELNRTGDSKAALVLNVINLHDDVKTLKDLISTTQDPDRILELQRQLQEKQDELNSKNADIERLIPHPKIILTVIELQNEIWELQKKAANGTTGGLVEELQTRLDGLITDIGDDNTKLMLKIITLQSQVEQLQRRLSDLQTLGATQVTQLTNDLATKKEELQKYVNELNEKNQTNARLILATTDLHNQLRNLEKEKHDEGKTTSAAITKLREQLKATVEEHSSDQAEIKALQNKLNQTEAQCSSFEDNLKDLQNDLDAKMKELQSKSDSVTSLALQVSTLTLQLEELKRQLQNTESETKIKELQKMIDEKKNELSKKTEELKERSSQPQRILQIITLQTEIEKLANVAANDTDYNKIRALQDHLNNLIDGIQDENNENTKLMFKILAQRDEIARLEKQENSQTQAAMEKIKDLENELEDIRNQIKEKKMVLDSSDTRISDLSAQIMELRKKIKPLEDKISDLKDTNAENVQELQKRLDLTKRQLQDSENRLKDADAKNFNSIMEIADLRTQLKKAQKKASKAAEKNIDELEQQLETQQKENRRLENTNKELQRKLQLKDEKCSGLEERYEEVKTEFEQKIAELNRTGDSKAALVLNVINLHDDVKTLKDLISTTQDPDRILELQRQLEEKQDELNSKTADIERLIPHPKIILTVIELQNEIWELQKKAANGTTGGLVEELQTRLDGLITDIGDDNTKLMLKIITLQSQVEQLQRRLSDLQTLGATQVTQLTNDLATKKEELQKYVNELNEKNQTNARLILATTDLHNQLRNLEKEKHDEGKTTSAAITKLREQLKATVEEHSSDQAEIKALQNKLNQTEGQCSSFENNLKDLQNNLDAKMKELQSKSDSVTSLALQVSTLTLQLEELKRQLQNTESETKIKELQKMIDEKNNELAKKTEELKERSAQPQRLLQIITLQTEIEKLVIVAANDTDYNKIRALQDHLNYLVDGIQDENNENTKLMFKILAQQDEIARLEKQEKSQTQAAMEKIKDLENELEDIRNQIKEKTMVLDSSDTRISDLSAQIMGLHKKIKPLEEEISDLKETNAENVEELQKRLDLTKTQLQDSEHRLKDADAKNFNSVMEIADLRTQLKKAQKKASKAAEKNIEELEQQLETQQRENRKLENTNKDLKQEVKELKMCCTDVNTECDDLQRQLQQSQEDADRLQQQLHEKDATLNQLQQELEEQRRENNTLQHEYDNLERHLHEKDATLNLLQQEFEEQTRENNRLQADIDNLLNEKNKLEGDVEDLQNKLTDVEDTTVFASEITLDPNTAHPRIALSADNTEVSTREEIQDVPDHPGRFDGVLAVLGKTGFSAGRRYWEVSVAGKSCYHLGMASESAQRRGPIRFSPTNGYWTVVLSKQGQYRALDRRPVIIPVQIQPVTLGILLDYKKGQISFYDAGTRSHMYTFVGQTFTDKIYPFIDFCVEDDGGRTPIVLLSPGSVEWIK